MDKYRIDSHKLIYHVNRVNSWLKGENVYPIYIEISLCGLCNHRCIFCAVDYLKYKPISLEEHHLKNFFRDASQKGVKSIMFAGSGEPLLHKRFSNIASASKKAGIDTAVTSNGVMLTKEKAESCLEYLSWFRASLNAGTAGTYAKVHRAKPGDFHEVLKNLENAVNIRNKNKYLCTIGTQLVLLPQNINEIIPLAHKLKGIGVDYLTIKPYSQHPLSINRLGKELNYKKMLYLENELEKYSTKDFNIIFRKKAMLKINTERKYQQNYGLCFSAYIDEKGDIYPCIEYSGRDEFIFGNIYEESFEKIWEGNRRESVMNKINHKSEVINSSRLTRMEEVNEYLWDLKNPPAHTNFI